MAIEREALQDKSKSLAHLFISDDTVKTGRRLILAWLVQFMNQAGGVNLIVYYAPSMIRLVLFSGSLSHSALRANDIQPR